MATLDRSTEEVVEMLQQINDRLTAVEGRLDGLPRHTHSTIACYEDALAVAADILMNEQVDRQRTRAAMNQLLIGLRTVMANLEMILEGGSAQREYTVARTTRIVKILQEGRQGPNAYHVDRPAGKRADPFERDK